jgi:spore germination cell wall hydrolase CwlJ-like protein
MHKGLAVAALVTTLAGLGVKQEPARTYSDEDLYVLSHIISAEAGNCSEDMMISVGSVVLNRVEDERFPDSIYEVVFETDPVQYSPTVNGTFWNDPTEGAVEVAERLLTEGSQIDASVVWQAEFPQGNGVYDTIDSPWGTTMYFCY